MPEERATPEVIHMLDKRGYRRSAAGRYSAKIYFSGNPTIQAVWGLQGTDSNGLSRYKVSRRTRGKYVQENTERWKLLCEQAAVEQDPKKLLELTKEITDLLLRKQHRLDGDPPPTEP